MALRVTPRRGLVIVIIAFMTTMVRTESGVSRDVPDDVVYTDLHKTVYEGDSVVLTCRFRGTPLAVWWKKGDDPETAPNLVSWIPTDNVTGLCEGERPCQIMEMDANRSLIIKEVSIAEQGRYICRVTIRGILIHNFTDISVFSPPQSPFPIIDQCPTGADGRGTQPCILTQETGADSIELTCRTMGATRGVVSLSWTLGGTTVTLKALQRSTNPDGVTEDVMVVISATPSADPYVCVAILPTTTRIQATMSVTVNAAPLIIGTTTESVMNTNGTASFPEPSNIKAIVIPVVILFIIVFVVVVVVVMLILRKRCKTRVRMRGCRHPKFHQIKDEGIISYFELEKLVEKFDITSMSLIVAELIEDSKRELEPECTKADLYKYLCEWKESSSGSAILLSSTMEKNNLENELQIVKDFFASADSTVSDDDLEHICWHVHSCRETVKPIVGSSFTKSTKPADNGHISAPPRCDEIRDDLQIMKRWRDATTYGDEDDQFDDTVKFLRKSEEIGLTRNNTQSMPSNQMIKLCRALEKAGRKTRDSNGQVYHQLSKTFYKIREEYKSKLTDEVLKGFALSITKRHSQRLGNTMKLSADAIATRNEEDLQMFRTDVMLKAWVLDQKCSNYEIRRRLRQAAEQCNRQDIADNFISKEQSDVMTSTTKLPGCLTITNEKQSPGASASGSKDKSGNNASSQSVPQSSTGDLKEMQSSVEQPTANITDYDIGFVSAISRDELDRIGRYAGSAVLLAFCKRYGVTEIPEQQSSEGKELPFETKIINVLKPTLDSVHEQINRERRYLRETPREILRQFLQNEHPRYACLLARRNPAWDIFNVELIDLAFRLIMADVYPFAKSLSISDQVLTPYRHNLGPHNLRQGTVKILKQVYTNGRFYMVKALKQAGYSDEARALYFGFEISFGDMVEVENRVDKAQLVKQLGVSDDVQLTGPDNLGKDGTLHQSVLIRWRDTVHSSTFNHRLVLADALFRMDEEQLALDIISGVYRNRAIDNPVSELLAATIPETDMPTLSNVLGQKVKNGQKSQDVISTWVNEKKLTKFFSKSPTKLSNELLGAGFYAFAHEIMAGAWKEDKKVVQKEGTENGKAANEELHQEGVPINEQGEQEGKEKKEGTEKATSGATPGETTGKESENKGKEEIEGMEKATNDDTPVENTGKEDETKEKSGDGAAESRENTTVNVDTNEQGNTPDGSDERKRDESSETPLLDTGKLDHWGDPIDNSRHKDPTAMSRYHDFI